MMHLTAADSLRALRAAWISSSCPTVSFMKLVLSSLLLLEDPNLGQLDFGSLGRPSLPKKWSSMCRANDS